MSRAFINEDFASGSTFDLLNGDTFTLTSFLSVGSGTLNGGFSTAVDGNAAYTIPAAQRPKEGVSQGGLRIQLDITFKRGTSTSPSGGLLTIFQFNGSTNLELRIESGADKLKYVHGGANATGATALGTSSHTIQMEYREEGSSHWMRVWLDGALEIDNRYSVGAVRIIEVTGLYLGVSASGKCTWSATWDNCRLWFATDPQ